MEPNNQVFWQRDPQEPADNQSAQVDETPHPPVDVALDFPNVSETASENALPEDVENDAAGADTAPLPTIAWEASESIHHEKDMVWFVGVGAVGVLLVLVAIFLLKSITFAVLVVIMTFALIFVAVRPQRVLRYQLSPGGLSINDNHYSFHEFRAFGVVQEGAMYYITLIPIKRFSPAVDIHFPQEHGEQIVDMIGSQVVMQEVKPDIIDRLTRHLRL